MSDETDRFWEELRKQASDPKGFTALTDEEAERRMAEAGEEPMSEEEIAEIVRTATAQGPQGVVHRDIEKPQARYLMKAAAAVVLTVVLVAGVVTTKAVLWPERVAPLRTIAYRDAILIALDSKEPESVRNKALGRIFVSTRIGILGLQGLRVEGNGLENATRSALRLLQQTVNTTAVFEERHRNAVHALRHPVKESVKFIQDTTNPLAERALRQQELGDQLVLGVLVLRKIQTTHQAKGLLATSSGLFLRRLQVQLAQESR